MLRTVIKKNSYQDSINLMLLTNKIAQMPNVNKVQIMMGTPANKDIFKAANILTPEAEQAKPSDMMIVLDVSSEEVVKDILEEINSSLTNLSSKKASCKSNVVHNWEQAMDASPNANLSLISIPGEYAAIEIERSLNNGLHTFVFSDNVSVEDESRLKKLAHEKGLLLMGPDCGTAILSNVPLAFTNHVRNGNIAIVGASGTGIQEVSTLIDKFGGGVCHAIGTGGHDLSEQVGAITTKDAVLALANYEPANVIVVISKPPAKKVRDEVVELLHSVKKPVVTIFLGEEPQDHEGNVYFAQTLEEAASIAVGLANGTNLYANCNRPLINKSAPKLPEGKKIVGLFSGGTLAGEASFIISDILGNDSGTLVLDLGDDKYTQGKPHPMMDPSTRIQFFKDYSAKEDTGLILFDVVLGEGGSKDMAGTLVPTITECIASAEKAGRKLYFVASVCGTKSDPQGYDNQVKLLKDAGVFVEESNVNAARLALYLVGARDYTLKDKKVLSYKGKIVSLGKPSKKIMDLLSTKPTVINIGLESFIEVIPNAIQFNWKPMAGGDVKLAKIITRILADKEVQEANLKIIEDYKNAIPFLIDVVPAISVIPELDGKVLLHAGPKIVWEDMTGPMQGSCVGAALFEGWAKDEAEAKKLLENGEVKFIPCHSVGAVGPMGGITSANMPVLVVENRLKGNRAYCTMNEGIGRVLRFGAFDDEVINRLKWMRNELMPTLSSALKTMPEGINLNVIVARAITMGDEFHQRNIAASLVLLKELVPSIVSLNIEEQVKKRVVKFLADTDQFFLNVMMAAGKSIVDGARTYQHGTVVTTMTRNGKDFGVRISGLGDEWFTAPVNTPEGLFFTGFSQEDANADMGDSAITETVGVGGMAMVAAPGVVRFVGYGGLDDAVNISNEMMEICISRNPNWTIPNWDFKGVPLGIDICKVVASGITPLINTGIAHKKAGLGQVGAGTVRAPLECFEKALIAYAKANGYGID